MHIPNTMQKNINIFLVQMAKIKGVTPD